MISVTYRFYADEYEDAANKVSFEPEMVSLFVFADDKFELFSVNLKFFSW